MMKKGRFKKYILGIGILFLAYLVVAPSSRSTAEGLTHTVQKGDTLWDICEKYYGDPDLWPKLWEMNPFITNPHFLHVGDVIALLEKEPLVATETPPKPAADPPKEAPPPFTGIDTAGLTSPDAAGYLSLTEVTPWGRIVSSENGKLILVPGDKVVVAFEEGREVKAGDRFTVYEPSPLLKHPLTGKDFGYSLSFHGTLVIKEFLKRSHYKAEILQVYKGVNLKDHVIPFEPVSPCVKPLPAEKDLIANIVAVKDQAGLIGQNTIVYLNKGFNQGIRRGNMLEVVQAIKIADLDFRGMDFLGVIKEICKSTTLEDLYRKMTEGTTLYEVPMGMVLVLESRPNTATAIILSAKTEFYNGSFVKGLSWVETPSSVSRMLRCAIK